MQEHLSAALADALLAHEDVDVCIVDETGSTNDDLKAAARRRAFSRPHLLAAARQTAGRGTQGRRWRTAELSLLFSLGLGLEERAAAGLLAVAAGLGVAEASRNFGLDVRLKWPNDIWAADGKAGGILCETVRDPSGVASLVVGVGCNLRIASVGGTTTNGWPVTDLAAAGGALLAESVNSRTAYLCGLVQAILGSIRRLQAGDAHAVMEDWAAFDAFFGREVRWTPREGGGVERRGIDRGIDAHGRLIIEPLGEDGSRTQGLLFLSGELSALTNRPAA